MGEIMKGKFQQELSNEIFGRFEFYYRDGHYWKSDPWTHERWELDKDVYWHTVSELPFFQRGTHIYTVHGEIMERVFVKIKTTTYNK